MLLQEVEHSSKVQFKVAFQCLFKTTENTEVTSNNPQDH